jgi:hypothetical protein
VRKRRKGRGGVQGGEEKGKSRDDIRARFPGGFENEEKMVDESEDAQTAASLRRRRESEERGGRGSMKIFVRFPSLCSVRSPAFLPIGRNSPSFLAHGRNATRAQCEKREIRKDQRRRQAGRRETERMNNIRGRKKRGEGMRGRENSLSY